MFGSGLSSLAQERKASKQNKSKLKTGDTPLKSGEREETEGGDDVAKKGTGKTLMILSVCVCFMNQYYLFNAQTTNVSILSV